MTTSTVNTKKKSFTTFQMALIAVMAAITCILGPLSIPIPVSPVPISLTNLAIYLTVCLLGWKFGTISYLIYLLIGIAGLPVFSSFSSGFAKLLGPTGGYLIGFIPMALLLKSFLTAVCRLPVLLSVLLLLTFSVQHGLPSKHILPFTRHYLPE